MASRICRSCSSRCYFITLKCLFEGDTVLNASLDSEKILVAMNSGQKTWILPMLGDCRDDICDAITELETNDTPLPTAIADLLDEVADLVRAATEYQYLIRGRVAVGREGIKLNFSDDKQWDNFMNGLMANLSVLRQNFKQWLIDHSTDFPCLPESTCARKVEESQDLFINSWGVSTPSRRLSDDPDYQTF